MAVAQAYHDNRSVADVARDKEYSRNIRRAQAAQQRKQKETTHLQQISQNVSASRQNIFQNQPKTQAQQKHALKKASIKNTSKTKGKKKQILKRIKKYQKIIDKQESVHWMLLWTASAMSFFGGFFTEFLFGYLFTVPAAIYIAIKLWGLFSGVERRENRAVALLANIVKLVPVISLLPAQMIYVYVSQNRSNHKIKESKKKIKALQRILRRMK